MAQTSDSVAAKASSDRGISISTTGSTAGVSLVASSPSRDATTVSAANVSTTHAGSASSGASAAGSIVASSGANVSPDGRSISAASGRCVTSVSTRADAAPSATVGSSTTVAAGASTTGGATVSSARVSTPSGSAVVASSVMVDATTGATGCSVVVAAGAFSGVGTSRAIENGGRTRRWRRNSIQMSSPPRAATTVNRSAPPAGLDAEFVLDRAHLAQAAQRVGGEQLREQPLHGPETQALTRKFDRTGSSHHVGFLPHVQHQGVAITANDGGQERINERHWNDNRPVLRGGALPLTGSPYITVLLWCFGPYTSER